ncbi:MAG TPA: SPOR domain-containing protein [Bacteroidales bacterium]|nr:SPOR domain-containing protein [Bacteroidales bacterium]
MKLEKYISELLYKHDCVIIPGLGGFVANPSPARILPFNNTFLPPSKDILFNVDLKKNDGLLANYVSYTENISFTESLNLIHREVEVFLIRLKNGNKLQLKNIGTLTMNREGSIQFEPDNTINYLEDSFGLTSFISPAIRRETERERLSNLFVDRKPASQRRILPQTLRWAAIVTPLLAISLWGAFNTNNIKDFYISHSNLLPSFSSKTEIVSPKLISKTRISEASILPLASLKKLAETPAEPELKYFIIGGAFQIKENAEKFVDRLNANGHHAAILDQTKTGLYRVSVDGFSTMDEASGKLNDISSEIHASAWILTK